VAVQGPVDPANLYVVVTWDRADYRTTGWRVYKDNILTDEIDDAGGPDDWSKRYYKDVSVTALATHRYEITPLYGTLEGPRSPVAAVTIRRSPPSKVVDVTAQAGATLRDKVDAAKAAAIALAPTFLEPAVLFFGSGTHTLATADTAGGTFTDSANNIIVRGAGKTATIIRAGFAGSASEASIDNVLFKWGGSTTALGGVNPTAAVVRGDRTVTLNDVTAFSVGSIIALNQITGDTTSADDFENYNAWDCNEVTAVNGKTITVKFPWAKPFTTAATVLKLTLSGCGIEHCTFEGESSTVQTYYTLLQAEHTVGFHMAEVRGRWCNRNVLYMRGYNPQIVGCTFTQTDPKVLAGESLRYDITAGRGSGMVIVGCDFGDLDRVGSSMVTTQVSHRQIVRHNRFYRSENYGWNEHGGGSHWNVFENNYVYMPEATKGGIFFGNSSFFYSAHQIVRGNLFDNCDTAAVACQQNSYGLRIVDNWFRDCPDDLVNWYGSDFADMPAELHGAARSVVKRNSVDDTTAAKANRGLIFGYNGGSDPYPGVKDLIIRDNELDVDADAIRLGGTSNESIGWRVSNNTGSADYTRPVQGSGTLWANNADYMPLFGPGTEGSAYFQDLFSGTAGASAGWPTYLRSTTTGTGTDFTISSSGNYGRLSCTSATAGARKIVCALRAERMHNSFVVCDFRDLSDAVSRIQALVARHAGVNANDDHYRAVYEYAAGSNRLRIEKVIAGVATVLVQSTAFDTDLVGDLRVKFDVTGGTPAVLRCKAWLISGGEPGSWTLETSDTSLTEAGKVGVLLDCPDAQTTTSDFDAYNLVNWTRDGQPAFGPPVAEQSWEREWFDWEAYDVATA